MTQLYVLAQQYRADLDQLAELDLDPQTLADTIEGMGGELEQKAVAVAMWARNLEASADAIEEAAKAMQERAKAARKRADSTRAYLLGAMQSTGIKKIECPHFVISVRQSPESVEIEDETQIPPDYMTDPKPVPPKPDKALIKRAIQDGFEVPGCKLVRGASLQIK